MYLAPHSRFDRSYINGEWHTHLILLCENMTGYRNLIHMVSCGFSEGFYMKPRIDMELLRAHSEGSHLPVRVSGGRDSACAGGRRYGRRV